MAKKLIAVTNINHDGEFTEAGGELDPSKFSRDQLKNLYDAGAVELTNVDEPAPAPTPGLETTGPVSETPEDENPEG